MVEFIRFIVGEEGGGREGLSNNKHFILPSMCSYACKWLGSFVIIVLNIPTL
jgi:hypothetical protein